MKETSPTTPTLEPVPEAEATPFVADVKLPWHRARASLISFGLPLAGLLVAFGFGAILLALTGVNPLEAYQALIRGAFGSRFNTIETFVKATPIMLIALGVTVAFRCSTWNIGSEGQLHIGAIAATVAGIALRGLGESLPVVIGVTVMMIAGFLGGGLYAAFAGVLKAKWQVNEVITTIMMNFVAILFLQFLIFGPMRDPAAEGLPMSTYIAEAAQLPRLFTSLFRSRLHIGVVMALISSVAVYIFLWKTTYGYQIRATGANPRAARHAGINVPRSIFLAMVVSGGMAGLAGMGEIAGLHYRLQDGISPGYGSAGIIVALLSNLHPVAIVPIAILFGGLITGGDMMARTMQVSTSIVIVIQGLMVLFVIGSQFLVAKWEA